ncbi:MAG: DUF3391 domain-containing protein [Pseudomonadota bacterium]
MAIDVIQIPVSQLKKGMFVSKLDVPWVQTPFPLQGFVVENDEQIGVLHKHCSRIFIDRYKSRLFKPENLKKNVRPKMSSRAFVKQTFGKASATKPNNTSTTVKKPNQPQRQTLKFHAHQPSYKITSSLGKECKKSEKIFHDISTEFERVCIDIRIGRNSDTKALNTLTRAMAQSIIRNPNAFMWMSAVKKYDDYYYGHAFRAATLGCLLSRHLGLSVEEISIISQSLILSVIGVAKVHNKILFEKLPEQKQSEKIWAHTMELLNNHLKVNPRVIRTVECFLERHDGSGFPRNLSRTEIPLSARIAGLTEFFCKLTYPKNLDEALTPAKAVSDLFAKKNRWFQGNLVDDFIQCIGIYPTGALVRLNNGAIAMVVSQSSETRIQPKVALLTDNKGRPLKSFKTLNLIETGEPGKDNSLHIMRPIEFKELKIGAEKLNQIILKIYRPK